VRNYPEFPQGSRNWDERIYHPDTHGVLRPLSELWPKQSSPLLIRGVIALVQLLGRAPMAGGLRIAWNDSHQLRLALGENDG
jgi:hypothetical protein